MQIKINLRRDSSPELPGKPEIQNYSHATRRIAFIRSLLFQRGVYTVGYLSSWLVYEKLGEILGFPASQMEPEICNPTERMCRIFAHFQIPQDPSKAVETCWNYWEMARYFAQFSAEEQDQIEHEVIELLKRKTPDGN